MSKIKIKNFGPIKEGFLGGDGFMDVKKVTVFIGNQGSGKSTVAKVISTLTWIEKALNRGDFTDKMSRNDFEQFFLYQNLKGYFKDNTVIEYHGSLYTIRFNPGENPHKQFPLIERIDTQSYTVPKIMYVPDGRSFLSIIKNATGVRGLPAPLFEFAEELKRGQTDTKGKEIPLPINGVNFKYESESDSSYIIGKDFKVNLLFASSGFQSLVPLFLVSSSLAHIIKSGSEIGPANISVDQSIRMNNEISAIMLGNKLSDIEKLKRVEIVKSKFQNKAFINIVEEPEQNLFPSSQQQLLNSLLEFNNMKDGNKLIITTHSPYLINYLTLAVEANGLKDKIKSPDLESKLKDIVPLDSTIQPHELVIYELDEQDGSIQLLGNYKGLPSDENKLNNALGEGNESFAKLLEIDQKL